MPHHQDESHSDTQNHDSVFAATLKTLGMASVGTGLLVVLHHKYRQQHDTQAQLQDYVVGAKVQLKRLHHANTQAIHGAKQSWLAAWSSQPDSNVDSNKDNQKNAVWQQQEVSASLVQGGVDGKQTIKAPTAQTLTNHHDKTTAVAWVSGVAELSKGEFAVVGIADDHSKTIVWQTPMPERVHDIVVQPVNMHQATSITSATSITPSAVTILTVDTHQHVVVMGRRPSE